MPVSGLDPECEARERNCVHPQLDAAIVTTTTTTANPTEARERTHPPIAGVPPLVRAGGMQQPTARED
jgi:hypothetical protein